MATTTRTRNTWRSHAEWVIQDVLNSRVEGETEQETRRRVEGAYPFGERARYPYKVWRAAVRAALGPKATPQKEAQEMPSLLDTHDETLNGLLAGYRDNPTDGFRRLVIADRLDELVQEGRARLVRAMKPKVADVARRLWPGSYLVHVTRLPSHLGRDEVQSKHGGFIMSVRDLCDMMEGNTLLVDPQVAEATEIERALAVLHLFEEKP